MFTFKETVFIIIAFITLTLVSYTYANIQRVPITELPSTLTCEQDPILSQLNVNRAWICAETK